MKTNFNCLFIALISIVLIAACDSSPSSSTEQNPIAEKSQKAETNPLNPIQKATTLEGKVKAIRLLFKDIQDNLQQFKTEQKTYVGELEIPISGEITAYKKAEQIVKLVDKAEEDHGPGINEFYFVNGDLFFLLSQVTTVEMTENPKRHVRELRLYFDDGQIIDALVKTKTFGHEETIDMGLIANERDGSLIGSEEEAEYYTELAKETLEFFQSSESFDEFYGGDEP